MPALNPFGAPITEERAKEIVERASSGDVAASEALAREVYAFCLECPTPRYAPLPMRAAWIELHVLLATSGRAPAPAPRTPANYTRTPEMFDSREPDL